MKKYIIKYLTVILLLLISTTSAQQTPGGISLTGGLTIEYWLKADELNTTLPTDGDIVNQWLDLSTNARHFTAPNKYYPRFKKSAMNFHSSVDFYKLIEEDITDDNNKTRKLQTTQLFAPSAGRSYYAIIVSALNPNETSSSNAAVFSLNRSTATLDTDNNSFGWLGAGIGDSNRGKNWMAIDGSDRDHSTAERIYGIGIFQIPNSGTSSHNPEIYNNTLKNTGNLSSRAMETNAQVSVIGNSNPGDGTNDYFYGHVMEIIIMSKNDTNVKLTADELNKINSSLAIKYGITLNHTAQTTYTLSNGAIVYDIESTLYTTYRNHLIGIARDDASGLFQKQSKSTDGDSPAVYLGEIAQTNYENKDTSLANLNAFVMGSNGLKGKVNYSYGSSTNFANLSLLANEKISDRANTTYRAKITGQSSMTINMELTGWEWILVSNNATFEPSSTRIYKIENNQAKDILVNDGDFISYAKYQYNPANLTNVNVEYWLNANEVSQGSVQDGDDVEYWMDLSPYGRNFFRHQSAYAPRFLKSAMNYNSAVEFYYDETNSNRRRNLQTEPGFTVENGKTYYVIQVSKLDSENSSNEAIVANLTANTENDNGRFGWTKTGKIYSETRGDLDEGTINLNKGYGIGIYQINGANSNGQKIMYNDAKKVFESSRSRMNPRSASITVLGGENADTNTNSESFYGELNEFIVLSTPTGSQLTTTDLKKLNSYLAIKYGLTLSNEDQTDYILSDGTEVYNSANAGFTAYTKDIFGIVRDDASYLHQKQSTSTDNSSLVVHLGKLENTNDENMNETLVDKEALFFGSNGMTGYSNYPMDPGTTFQNYTLSIANQEKLSLISNYKYRAKKTGGNGNSLTVNMKANIGEWVVISTNPSFPPATTRIYKLDQGNIENILINDGDYIGFATFIRAPAGVSNGLVMWLNASKKNNITLNSANEVTNWVDFSGYGTQFSKINANSTAPLYVEAEERMNFHPSVYFRKSKEYLTTRKGPFSLAAPEDYSFFTALNANFNTSSKIFFTSYGALKRSNYPALGVQAGSTNGYGQARIQDNGGAGSVDGKIDLFKVGATSIIGHTMHRTLGNTSSSAGNYFRFYADGYLENLPENSAGVSSRLNGPGTLGVGGRTDSKNMIGYMGDHIVYESNLSEDDRNKIDSYLGLKSAITIDKNKNDISTNFNFILSDGTSVWNGNDVTHQNYHNNVASLVRDDKSELENKQSKSTDVGAIVHMGVGNRLGSNPDLTEIVDDKTSLTWGHNGGSLGEISLAGNSDVCGDLDSNINSRVWLVDNTNFTQNVILRAGGALFPYNGSNYQVFLLVADSPTKIAANNWDQIIPMTYVDGQHQINYKFTDKFTYFTFGAKTNQVCEGCNFQGIKELDFSRDNWPNNGDKGPRSFNLGDNLNVKLTIDDPQEKLRRRYPRASLSKTLKEYRRSTTDPITTHIQFLDNENQPVSSAATFEIFDIDRRGKSLDDVQIIGYCNGIPSYPIINYVDPRENRSTYIKNDLTGNAIAKDKNVRYNANVAYTNKRGRAKIIFENPVQEIRIIYKTVNNTSNSNYIAIGKLEMYCPIPPPPPNEDGLILMKQATSEVQLCEIVDYNFRAINTNCDTKIVTLEDTLPEGMIWIEDSFTSSIPLDDAIITGYGTRTLTVSNLHLEGGAVTNYYGASAAFEMNATAGNYSNQARFVYDRSGTPVALYSTDRFTGNPTSVTIAHASDRSIPIITTTSTDVTCFKLGGEIEVTIAMENANAFSLTNMLLFAAYDQDSFSLVDGSIQTSGFSIGNNLGEAGDLEFEDFTLPSGKHWVKFKLRAANNLGDFEIDPETLNPFELAIEYELTSESADECLAAATANANGIIEIPFCTWCTKPPIGGTPLNSSVGISVLKENMLGWPENVPNGFLVLESGKKGMVLTRTTPAAIGSQNWQQGMIIYNTQSNCISIYNGSVWKCIERACNE